MNVDRIPCMQRIKILGSRDFVAFPSKDIVQEIDHGTKVLSTMAVDEPGVFVGTAPEATFFLCRTEDANTESRAEEDYWTAAAEFADSIGVDIISSSLGYHDFNDKSTNYTYENLDGHTSLVSQTASVLSRKGILLLNSAGNDGMGTWKLIGVPADADNILTVGAVNGQRQNAAFSSLGPTADGRVKPDVMSQGSPAAVVTGRGTIINDMGTSFSTPIMTGMVACLWQALRGKTAHEIIQIVRQSGHLYTKPNNVFGYGIPDFEKALIIGRKNDTTHETSDF
jgi:subtilisin family serine protease